jgi:long-subunit fatty acid transport protein
MICRFQNRVFSCLVFVAALALFVGTATAASDAGRTAANFLQIGVGAQAAGMGGAYSAISQGVGSTYWNPAGLAGMSGTEISLTHFSWYQDVKLNNGAIAVPISDRFTIGLSATHLDYGVIDGYDDHGLSTGQISSYDLAGALSLGWAINDRLSIGATGKYINQKLADLNVSGFAADLGLAWRFPHIAFAAVLANVGPFLKYEQISEHLPTTGRLSIAVTPFGNSFLTAFEVEKAQVGDVTLKQGIEYNYNEQYFLRAGYNYYPNRETMNFGSGPTFGAGLKFNRAGIDYAYTPKDSHTSDDLHRFSLTFFLGH